MSDRLLTWVIIHRSPLHFVDMIAFHADFTQVFVLFNEVIVENLLSFRVLFQQLFKSFLLHSIELHEGWLVVPDAELVLIERYLFLAILMQVLHLNFTLLFHKLIHAYRSVIKWQAVFHQHLIYVKRGPSLVNHYWLLKLSLLCHSHRTFPDYKHLKALPIAVLDHLSSQVLPIREAHYEVTYECLLAPSDQWV